METGECYSYSTKVQIPTANDGFIILKNYRLRCQKIQKSFFV